MPAEPHIGREGWAYTRLFRSNKILPQLVYLSITFGSIIYHVIVSVILWQIVLLIYIIVKVNKITKIFCFHRFWFWKFKSPADKMIRRKCDHEKAHTLLRQVSKFVCINLLSIFISEPVTSFSDLVLKSKKPRTAVTVTKERSIFQDQNRGSLGPKLSKQPNNLKEQFTSIIIKTGTCSRLRETLAWETGMKDIYRLQVIGRDGHLSDVLLDDSGRRDVGSIGFNGVLIQLQRPLSFDPLALES